MDIETAEKRILRLFNVSGSLPMLKRDCGLFPVGASSNPTIKTLDPIEHKPRVTRS